MRWCSFIGLFHPSKNRLLSDLQNFLLYLLLRIILIVLPCIGLTVNTTVQIIAIQNFMTFKLSVWRHVRWHRADNYFSYPPCRFTLIYDPQNYRPSRFNRLHLMVHCLVSYVGLVKSSQNLSLTLELYFVSVN